MKHLPRSGHRQGAAAHRGSTGAEGLAAIAIVEDNPLVAKFFRLAIERSGNFQALVVENVDALLEQIAAGRISMLLLDITLPHLRWQGRAIDGVELARLAREHAPAHLPILVATAHAMPGDRERILEACGADDLIEKPIYDAAQLVERVRGLLKASSP